MAHPSNNTFSTYKLTEEEQRNGSILSSLTVAVIQNLRSGIAEEKIRLTIDPNNTLSFIQQEAYLRGQLDILTYLLDTNDEQRT